MSCRKVRRSLTLGHEVSVTHLPSPHPAGIFSLPSSPEGRAQGSEMLRETETSLMELPSWYLLELFHVIISYCCQSLTAPDS